MLPTIPGYSIDQELGRGGMGVVYKCRQDSTHRVMALKLLLRGKGADFEDLARFRVEAEALACLDHRNITKIFDIGVFEGCPYFATEYAPRGTIRDYATAHDKSIEWSVDAIRQISSAVHHAHTRWMIHRDIKPANILVMDDETPKITDFGLVKFTARVQYVADASRAPAVDASFAPFDSLLNRFSDELKFEYREAYETGRELLGSLRNRCLERTHLPDQSIDLARVEEFMDTVTCDVDTPDKTLPDLNALTQTQEILGSPYFMSPEQAVGDVRAIGPRTDVYGLGATLYWLLTGEHVVSGANMYDIITSIADERVFPQSAQELNPRVSDAVNCVVWKAIQKDPRRRYENCKILAEELHCCLQGPKPGALRRHEERIRKHNERQEHEAAEKRKYADIFKKAFPGKHDKNGS